MEPPTLNIINGIVCYYEGKRSDFKDRFTYIVETKEQALFCAGLSMHRAKGYIRCTYQRSDYMLHRLLMIMFGPQPVPYNWKNLEINHKNHIRNDNRISNLEWVTSSTNNLKRKKLKNNTSGTTGVSFESGKWRARLRLNKKSIPLGMFDTKEEAIEARKAGELKHLGYLI